MQQCVRNNIQQNIARSAACSIRHMTYNTGDELNDASLLLVNETCPRCESVVCSIVNQWYNHQMPYSERSLRSRFNVKYCSMKMKYTCCISHVCCILYARNSVAFNVGVCVRSLTEIYANVEHGQCNWASISINIANNYNLTNTETKRLLTLTALTGTQKNLIQTSRNKEVRREVL